MICFVAVNYNNSDHTLRYLESIFLIENLESFKVVIVDNASSHIERKKLEDSLYYLDDRINFVFSEQNIGYFPGVNLGIQSVSNLAIDLWVVGNNDVKFPSEFYNQIRSIPSYIESYPVIAPRIETLEDIQQNPHVIGRISQFRERIYDVFYYSYLFSQIIMWLKPLLSGINHRRDEERYMEILEIEQGFGACYILTSLFFENFDDLASPSFLYHEEAFLAAQLNSLGLKTLYHPAVCVKHSCKAATGKLLPSQKWRIASKSHWELRKLERELVNNHD